MAFMVQELPQAGSDENDLLIGALMGKGLPARAEEHLRKAGLYYQSDQIAEQHLYEAQAQAPNHAALLIGLYRFYFYKGRLEEALEVAEICLAKTARENNLLFDWRRVEPNSALFGDYEAMLPRFYLFTLKAYAYLQMRLGDLREGVEAVEKLLELDPSDKVGAKVLLDVARRAEREEDD